MDKRLELNERQTEIVDRICQVIEELKQEKVGFFFYDESLRQPETFWMMVFYNARDVQCLHAPEGYLDNDDVRYDCAYVDADGTSYVEPDSEEFGDDSIFFRFMEDQLPFIDFAQDIFRSPYLDIEFKEE